MILRISTLRIAGLALAIALLTAAPVYAADTVLHGTIRAQSGAPMAGATVSAKALGTNITRTVFTDVQGNYYFPSLPAGKYQVWAQAQT
jgi:protocatechuate 3,4-dioxygenase beta subunit